MCDRRPIPCVPKSPTPTAARRGIRVFSGISLELGPPERHTVYMDKPELSAPTVEDAFAKYAEHLADLVGTKGWDQPATLWAVFMQDAPTEGQTSGLSVSLSSAPLAELEGSPAEALVGMHAPDSAVAIAIVCEGWAHHPRRVETGDVDRAPSEYEDSVEVRLVHFIARDGTEILAHSSRTGLYPKSVQCGTQFGRLPEAARRVIGLPSHADQPQVSVETIRSRIYPALLRAGVFAMAPAGPSALTWALDELEHRHSHLWKATAEHFGLFEPSWDAAITKATNLASEQQDSATPPYGEDLRRLLGWADGSMWARALEDVFPPRVDVVLSLEHLRLSGVLSTSQFRRAVDLLDRMGEP